MKNVSSICQNWNLWARCSECGVGPSEATVSAVMNARERTSVSEVRSWLGLV